MRRKKKRVQPLVWRLILFLVLSFVFLPLLESALTSKPPPIDVRYTYTSIFIVMLLVLMVVVNREKLFKHKFEQSVWQTAIFGGAAYMVFTFFLMFKYTNKVAYVIQNAPTYIIGLGALQLISVLLIALAVFNIDFFKDFQREAMIVLIFALPYLSLSLLIKESWQVFSATLTRANVWLLGWISPGVEAVIRGDPLLGIEGFSVIIGAPCSGVESLIMFAGVLGFIGLLDWQRLNKKKFLMLLPIGLAGMFIMSILRIFILMLVGGYISPELSLSLFHTNTGWILFVVYTLAFLYVGYPKMVHKR